MNRSAFEALSADEMEQRIEAQGQKLKEIFDIAQELVRTLGVVTKSEVHSCHVHVESELTDVERFYIRLVEGFSMFGGARLQIHHRGEEMLNMEVWDTFRVKKFVGYEWIEKLHDIMKRKGAILARRNQADEKQRLNDQHEAQEQRRKRVLIETAAELGLF